MLRLVEVRLEQGTVNMKPTTLHLSPAITDFRSLCLRKPCAWRHNPTRYSLSVGI